MKTNLLVSLLVSSALLTGCSRKKDLVPPTPSNTDAKRMKPMNYLVQEQLKPTNLDAISQEQIDTHWALYKGYVANVNKLNDELKQLRADGKLDTPSYADRRRRYGFEYNGMVLHEYYFGNMKSGASTLADSELKTAIEQTWGSYDDWRADFEAAGKSRSIGWAILYMDETTGALSNHFIQEHEDGNVAGFQPILVLDVWEHAYMVDFGTAGRGKYIAAFMNNLDWSKVIQRFTAVKNGTIASRF